MKDRTKFIITFLLVVFLLGNIYLSYKLVEQKEDLSNQQNAVALTDADQAKAVDASMQLRQQELARKQQEVDLKLKQLSEDTQKAKETLDAANKRSTEADLEKKRIDEERAKLEIQKAELELVRASIVSKQNVTSASENTAVAINGIDTSALYSGDKKWSLNVDFMKDLSWHTQQMFAENPSLQLSDFIQKRIKNLQDPDDCTNNKFLVCHIYNGCGFGCGLHQLLYCFVSAIGSNRTFYIAHDPFSWNYARDCPHETGNSWECFFEPVTTCALTVEDQASAPSLVDNTAQDARVVRLDYFARHAGANFVKWAATDGKHTNVPFFIPPEIKEKISAVHGDYRVWLVGHLYRWLMRPNAATAELIKEYSDRINLQHPVASVHIRRTDHGGEAPFREVPEYMVHVDNWFAANHPNAKRRVFLASDEPKVFEEARQKYPDYEFYNVVNHRGTPSGEGIGQRYSRMSLVILLTELFSMSQTDYFVGTMSSQVGRSVYELMQPLHTDGSKLMVSLDDPWYFP